MHGILFGRLVLLLLVIAKWLCRILHPIILCLSIHDHSHFLEILKEYIFLNLKIELLFNVFGPYSFEGLLFHCRHKGPPKKNESSISFRVWWDHFSRTVSCLNKDPTLKRNFSLIPEKTIMMRFLKLNSLFFLNVSIKDELIP